jgi:hypothetical protein
VTADPVQFDRIVSAWASENHQPSHELTLMLSKASRFIAWLRSDRNDRGVPDLPEDMRLVTHAEFVRYKEYLLKHSKGSRGEPPIEGPPTGLGYTSVCRHLGDLRTLFNYAAKNHRFPNPSDEVTLPKRTPRIMARNKWRSFTPEERTLILAEARKAGPVIRWCQWLGWGIEPGSPRSPKPRHSTSFRSAVCGVSRSCSTTARKPRI